MTTILMTTQTSGQSYQNSNFDIWWADSRYLAACNESKKNIGKGHKNMIIGITEGPHMVPSSEKMKLKQALSHIAIKSDVIKTANNFLKLWLLQKCIRTFI